MIAFRQGRNVGYDTESITKAIKLQPLHTNCATFCSTANVLYRKVGAQYNKHVMIKIRRQLLQRFMCHNKKQKNWLSLEFARSTIIFWRHPYSFVKYYRTHRL